MNFTTNYDAIFKRIGEVNPVEYGRTRNFLDGAVTYLSPYISRGVISTKQVLNIILQRGYDTSEIEKFIQELAWRDYWQQVWVEKGNLINEDFRHAQPDVENYEMPRALLSATTGINVIDTAIKNLQENGYMHNHNRMYTAAIACNMGKSHWKTPAKWMYYNLLDGDWASNALSWQWVAGSNSNKKYVANQANINKYSKTSQTGTFLDVPYEAFNNFNTPNELKPTENPVLITNLPQSDELAINPKLPTYLYTSYNLDPLWGSTIEANRILIFEPGQFETYPIADHVIQFIQDLGKNIPNLHVFTGSFNALTEQYKLTDVHYKEHPLNNHFKGTKHERDWMFETKGYYRSFFAFWKKCRKEL